MATIKDVARAAGVSVTTVSRALNNYSDVNVDTKARIQEVATRLNYVPNRAAQSLVKKENRTLALILSGLEKEGGKDNIVYRMLAGMYAYAETRDYDVALYTTDSAHQKKKGYIEFCREHNISGAVFNGMRLDDPYLKEIFDSGMPCVLIDLDMEAANVSSITIDNIQAAKEAVKLLLDKNHRTIGCVIGREEADVTIKRLTGYGMALKEYGIAYDETLVVCGNYMEDEAYYETKSLLNKRQDITALFCLSDMMALGAIRAIRDMGLSVPEDISVIGFDDIPLSAYLNPPLATVHQDFYQMGFQSARLLMNMVQEGAGGKKIIIEHKVLDRATVTML